MRAFVQIAARALGVATAADLRDYFRLPLAETRRAVAKLVESGVLTKVAVKGWSNEAFLDASATIPWQIEARALLAPFDPLIWGRSRTERHYDFRYRLEDLHAGGQARARLLRASLPPRRPPRC